MRKMVVLLIASILWLPVVSVLGGDYEVGGALKDGSILEERNGILIEGDSDFTSDNGVSSGSGILSDPYIIENFRINTSKTNGIDIRNTSSHFEIRNCLISGGNDKRSGFLGISLINVKNGSVINCDINNNHRGIIGEGSSDTEIKNCTITGNMYGILFSQNCRNLNITEMECNNNSVGVRLGQEVSDCHIANNSFRKNMFSGIVLWDGCSGNTIENNTCSESYWGVTPKDIGGSGIYLKSSDNNYIRFNTCAKNTGYAISLSDSGDNLVYNNYLSNNRRNDPESGTGKNTYGLNIQNSRGNVFEDNVLTNCGIDLHQDDSGNYFNTIDGSNKVNGRSIVYVKSDKTKETFSGDIGPVILYNCGNKTISGLKVVNIPSSIIVIKSDNITIKENGFSNFSYGIKILFSIYITVSENSFQNGFIHGISIEYTERSVIGDNRFENIAGRGIESLHGSKISSLFIDCNSFLDCGTGIRLVECDYRIIHNIFYSCRYDGISLQKSKGDLNWNKIVFNDVGISGGSCYDTGIGGNIIMGNGVGMDISANGEVLIRDNNITGNQGYGIRIGSYSTSGLSIHNNSFYRNNNGGVQASDESQLASWDDGISRGNYWSDYEDRYVPPASNDDVTWNITYVVDDGYIPPQPGPNNDTRSTRSRGSDVGDDYPLVYSPVNISYTLSLTTSQNENAYVDRQYNVTVVMAYSEEYSDLSQFADTNASWLEIVKVGYNHLIKGIPKAEDIGEYWVNISAEDGILEEHLNFTLTVGYGSLIIKTSNVLYVDQGIRYRVDYDVEGDQESLSWKLETDAVFLSMDNETGVLSGTPGWDDVGVFLVNISVSDGVLSTKTSFRLTVNDVNDPPQDLEILIKSIELKEGGDQTVSASYFDPDIGDNASVSWYVDGVLFSNLTTVNLSLPEGNYTLTLRVTDSNNNYSETSISIRVNKKEGVGPDPDPEGSNWVPIITASFVILVIIGSLLVVLRKRRSKVKEETVVETLRSDFGRTRFSDRSLDKSLRPEPDLIRTGRIGGPLQYEIDEFQLEGKNLEMDDIVSEALGPHYVPGSHDTFNMLKRLKEKREDGDLTEREYRMIRKRIERIFEE